MFPSLRNSFPALSNTGLLFAGIFQKVNIPLHFTGQYILQPVSIPVIHPWGGPGAYIKIPASHFKDVRDFMTGSESVPIFMNTLIVPSMLPASRSFLPSPFQSTTDGYAPCHPKAAAFTAEQMPVHVRIRVCPLKDGPESVPVFFPVVIPVIYKGDRPLV
jgi:hypothetical protein